MGSGFGLLALGDLLGRKAFAAPREQLPHHRATARAVIFLYMDGGPSHVDTFDPKPRLNAEDGEPFAMEMERTQFENNGNTLGSPWKFRQYGESGIPVSDLFPYVGQCADDLCVIRSMTSQFSEHTNANYFLHTGHGQAGRPSMGAWASYGLGSESEDLPSFIVLNGDLIPPGGLQCFGSGFLPATHEGSVFQVRGGVANIERMEETASRQRAKLDWIGRMDERFAERSAGDDAVESAIANYELAFRMQSAVPELMEIDGESEETQELYGLDAEDEATRRYGKQCLLARRMVERGVRFIELTCPRVGDNDRWDQHSNLKAHHEANARAVDRPIAGLLRDLKRRGLLDSTLVVWSGEFGRTPFAQGDNGRGPQPVRLLRVARRRRDQGRHRVRRDGRVRLQGGREQDGDPRSPRHDPAPDGHRPQTADLPVRRTRHAPHRRARPRGPRAARLVRTLLEPR